MLSIVVLILSAYASLQLAHGGFASGFTANSPFPSLKSLASALLPSAGTSGRNQSSASLRRVLILDVDGTLYDEEKCLIEKQIRQNIYTFAHSTANITADVANSLHREYGATILGLCLTLGYNHRATEALLLQYYNEVYRNLICNVRGEAGLSGIDGYSDIESNAASSLIRKLISSGYCDVVVASNSPLFHIRKVLLRLQMADIPFAAIVSPERIRNAAIKSEIEYWQHLFSTVEEQYLHTADSGDGKESSTDFEYTLIDDNAMNIHVADRVGIRGIQIRNEPSVKLLEALLRFMNVLPAATASDHQVGSKEGDNAFVFDSVSYINAKNVIDEVAINKDVFLKLEHHLRQRFIRKLLMSSSNSFNAGDTQLLENLQQQRLRINIVDLGCGKLFMKDKILRLYHHIAQPFASNISHVNFTYFAVEENLDLIKSAHGDLIKAGYIYSNITDSTDGVLLHAGRYTRVQQSSGIDAHWEETIYIISGNFLSRNVKNFIRKINVQDDNDRYPKDSCAIDLILAHCLVDLFDPNILLSSIVDINDDNGAVLYAPISFFGDTSVMNSSYSRKHPWLTKRIFEAYHSHLQAVGHHLEYQELLQTLSSFGCKSLLAGIYHSPWIISARKHPTMFACMMRFIAMGVVPSLFVADGNGDGNGAGNEKEKDNDLLIDWFKYHSSQSGRDEDCTIIADNFDLLVELPYVCQEIISTGSVHGSDCEHMNQTLKYDIGKENNYFATAFMFNGSNNREKMDPSSFHLSDFYNSLSIINGDGDEETSNLISKENIIDDITISEIVFIGPKNVTVQNKTLLANGLIDNPYNLSEDEVLIACEYSLISTGTELKIYRGDVDNSVAIDSAFDDGKMGFPMTYGYCFVGKIISLGPISAESRTKIANIFTDGSNSDRIAADDIMGRRVFSFSPHASHAICKISDVIFVPGDISAVDAAFLPNVETAVSLAQAANPRIGEVVAVVGQGMIGILTAAVLRLNMMNINPLDLHLIDISPLRLQATEQFNPSCHIYNPKSPSSPPPAVDVAIEVTGHHSGLQLAVDITDNYGKVIVGSFFGEGVNPLKLGMRFHRSGISLHASQVSFIPPDMAGRWTKKRRFDVAFNAIRKILPSRLLFAIGNGDHNNQGNRNFVHMNDVEIKGAYDRLDKGESLAIVIDHSKSDV